MPIIFLAFFYFLPVFANFQMAWKATTPEFITTTSWNVISKPLIFTFWQAILSTLLTIIVGFPAAYLMAKFKFRGKSFMVECSSSTIIFFRSTTDSDFKFIRSDFARSCFL
jgi:thiamine transport system permease protein